MVFRSIEPSFQGDSDVDYPPGTWRATRYPADTQSVLPRDVYQSFVCIHLPL
jgi:hypothetical protein